MENENKENQTQEENSIVYVIGAIIVIAIVVTAVIMWPKKKAEQTASPTPESSSVITKTPLTKLVCENEWFNPVIGMPKFYLSAEGGDVSAGTQVECTFNIIKDKETVVTETMKVPVTQAPERGGTTYKCTTRALEKIPMNTPVTMVAIVKNDDGQTASCSGAVTFR